MDIIPQHPIIIFNNSVIKIIEKEEEEEKNTVLRNKSCIKKIICGIRSSV